MRPHQPAAQVLPAPPALRPQSPAAALGPAVMLALLAGPLLSMIDSNVVNVAVSDISSQLHGPLDTVQWTVSGYLLALAAGLPATAFLAKRFGMVRVYTISLAAFTVVSLLCAGARTVPQLVAVRVVQGVVAAPLVPLSLGLIMGPAGGDRRRIPVSAAVVLFLGPALGPTVGGLLVSTWGWPSIFLVNAPIGVAALCAVPTLARRGITAAGDPGARPDTTGLLLLSAGLGLPLFGCSQGSLRGWLTTASWPFWVAGTLTVGCYVLWARRRTDPAVDLSLLGHRQPARAVWLCALTSLAMFSVLFLIPVLLQDVQGRSALTNGLVLLPQGLLMGLSTRWGMDLSRAGHLRATVVIGTLGVAVTTGLLLTVTTVTPPWVIAVIMSGRGLGVGFVVQPLLVALLSGLPECRLADTTTLFNVAQRLGGSIGVSLLATLFTLRVTYRTGAVLAAHAPRSQGGRGIGIGSLAAAPPPLRPRLADAAMSGFHDTVLVILAVVAAATLGATFLTQPAADTDPSGPGAAP